MTNHKDIFERVEQEIKNDWNQKEQDEKDKIKDDEMGLEHYIQTEARQRNVEFGPKPMQRIMKDLKDSDQDETIIESNGTVIAHTKHIDIS